MVMCLDADDILELNNETDFRELYDRYSPFITKLVARLVYTDPSSVDDLVQETFSHAYRFRHQFVEGEPVRSWLIKIARNLTTNHLTAMNRQKRQPTGKIYSLMSDEDGADSSGRQKGIYAPNTADPSFAMEIEEERSALWGAINKLPERERTITQYVLNGVTQRDIAEKMNLSKTRVLEIWKNIQEQLILTLQD